MKKQYNETFYVIAQAFYGNRTITDIREDEIDDLISGFQTIKDDIFGKRKEIIVPESNDLYIIYNPEKEKKYLAEAEEENYKPTLIIPSENIILYSRCIVCKRDVNGNYISVTEEDCKKAFKYLAE